MEDTVKEILSMFYSDREVAKRLPFHLSEGNRYNKKTIYNLLIENDKETAIKKFEEYLEVHRKKGTLVGFVERYGPEEGTRKYFEKNKKLSVGYDSLKASGKSEEEIARIKQTHRQKSAATEERFIKNYGENVGLIKFEEWKKSSKFRSVRCEEFWIQKGCNRTEAKKRVSSVQRRDEDFFLDKGWTLSEYEDYCKKKTKGFLLEGFVEKYGEEDGEKLYRYHKQKSSSLDYYIEKYGEIDGHIRYANMLKLKASGTMQRNSNVQKEFAEILYNQLPLDLKVEFVGEPITPGKWIHYSPNDFNIRSSVPDICIKHIIIEFDGDYWHSFEHVKARDEQKDKLNQQLGFTTFRVAENKFRKNPTETINQTLQFINCNIKKGNNDED